MMFSEKTELRNSDRKSVLKPSDAKIASDDMTK